MNKEKNPSDTMGKIAADLIEKISQLEDALEAISALITELKDESKDDKHRASLEIVAISSLMLRVRMNLTSIIETSLKELSDHNSEQARRKDGTSTNVQ